MRTHSQIPLQGDCGAVPAQLLHQIKASPREPEAGLALDAVGGPLEAEEEVEGGGAGARRPTTAHVRDAAPAQGCALAAPVSAPQPLHLARAVRVLGGEPGPAIAPAAAHAADHALQRHHRSRLAGDGAGHGGAATAQHSAIPGLNPRGVPGPVRGADAGGDGGAALGAAEGGSERGGERGPHSAALLRCAEAAAGEHVARKALDDGGRGVAAPVLGCGAEVVPRFNLLLWGRGR